MRRFKFVLFSTIIAIAGCSDYGNVGADDYGEDNDNISTELDFVLVNVDCSCLFYNLNSYRLDESTGEGYGGAGYRISDTWRVVPDESDWGSSIYSWTMEDAVGSVDKEAHIELTIADDSSQIVRFFFKSTYSGIESGVQIAMTREYEINDMTLSGQYFTNSGLTKTMWYELKGTDLVGRASVKVNDLKGNVRQTVTSLDSSSDSDLIQVTLTYIDKSIPN